MLLRSRIVDRKIEHCCGPGKLLFPVSQLRLERFIMGDKLPRSVIVVEVDTVFFQCSKAIMRSKLWSQEAQVARSAMPSISEIIHDQTRLGTPEPQHVTDARWREQL